jgi:hypothetical protein
LRLKKWHDPGPVLFDHQVFVKTPLRSECRAPPPDRVFIEANWDVMFEILSEPEKATSCSDYLGYARRWKPSEYNFDPVVEFVIRAPAEPVTMLSVARKVNAWQHGKGKELVI